MASDKKLEQLEAEVRSLKEKEKKLEHDLAIYRQVFSHLRQQFEHMKKEIMNKKNP